jgi:hypothetical protein
LRQEQTVGGDHERFGARRGDFLAGSRILEACGLKNLKAILDGDLLDGALGRAQAPARRPIRLRQYQRNFMTGIEQRGERLRREVRCAGEN